jgi:hypothetical protein
MRKQPIDPTPSSEDRAAMARDSFAKRRAVRVTYSGVTRPARVWPMGRRRSASRAACATGSRTGRGPVPQNGPFAARDRFASVLNLAEAHARRIVVVVIDHLALRL